MKDNDEILWLLSTFIPRNYKKLIVCRSGNKTVSMAVIEELKEGEDNLENCFEKADKTLKIGADTNLDEIEEFFRDSDVDEPTEAEKIMMAEDAAKFKEGVAKEREKYQPTAAEKIFATMKSIILRALAFYIIMWFFKRNSTPGGIPYGGIPKDTEDFGDDEEDLVSQIPDIDEYKEEL